MLEPRACLTWGRFGSVMAMWKEPLWAGTLKAPAPVAVSGWASPGTVICMPMVMRYPGVAVEAVAARATGSTTLPAPQPAVARARTAQAPAAMATAGARGERMVNLMRRRVAGCGEGGGGWPAQAESAVTALCALSFSGTASMACSARAVMVSDGLTPGLAGTTDPSQTSRRSYPNTRW